MDAVFCLPPDWSEVVSIGHIANTGMLKSITGTEQRSALYTWPRMKVGYTAAPSAYTHKAWLTRELWKNLHNTWGVPIWPDETLLTVQASSSQSVLSVGETAYRRFYAGGRCIVMNPSNPLSYETGVIATVGVTSITLDAGLASTWPSGSAVYPLIVGRLRAEQSATRKSHKIVAIDIEIVESFGVDDDHHAIDHTQSVTQYMGYDVFLHPPLIHQSVGFAHAYQLFRALGPSISSSYLSETEMRFAFQHTCDSRSAIWDKVLFFDVVKGRYGSFWVPSYQPDIQVTAGFDAGATSISITDIDYDTYWFVNDATGRHLFFWFPDGSYALRSITGATSTSLTLNSAIGTACASSDLDRLMVGFLHFCRFAHDEMTIDYSYRIATAADIQTQFITIPFEAPVIT